MNLRIVRIRPPIVLTALASALVLGACASAPATAPSGAPSEAIGQTEARAIAIVAAPDRDAADLALDAGRAPAKLIAFTQVLPNMRVADLGAGGGYTTELLARAVGDGGVVFSQNPKFVVEKFAEKPWSERLAKPIMRKVVRVDREFDEPLPPEAKDLDLIVNVLFYHDTVWLGADRARMNRALFDALRPGGSYVVVDHSARDGSGVEDVKTFHRIDENVVRTELVAAGFELVDEADFLRNPSDTRDWNDSPSAAGERRGTSDRFVLRFRKPASP